MDTLEVSERRACTVLDVPRSSVRYAPVRADVDQPLVIELHRLSAKRPRLGYRKITALLRKEGWNVNRKRVARLWRLHGLQVSRKSVKRRRAGPQIDGQERYRAERPHQVWAIDFVHDATADGRRLKILTINDEFTKICLLALPARSIKARDVIQEVERLMTLHGPPERVRSDNGPEFVANAVRAYLADSSIGAMFIEPGSPWENPFAETFHARLRDELLNLELFDTLAEAKVVIEQFRRYYNEERPHGALKYDTPSEFMKRFQPASGILAPEIPTP